MSNSRIAGRILRSAVLAGAITSLCMSALAQDQEASATDVDDGRIEEIITTGTRIRNENIVASSAVKTI